MLASLYVMQQDTITLRSYSCQQKLTFSDTPTAGSFKITCLDKTTASLNYNTTSALIQTALQNKKIDAIVTGSIASGFLITFTGCLANKDISKIIITDNTLIKSTTLVSLTVTYTARGRDEIGVWLQGIESNKEVKASIQPLGGKDFQLLLEGDRKKEAYEIYTVTSINNDQMVIYNNKEFEINRIEKWCGYYYAIITARRPV